MSRDAHRRLDVLLRALAEGTRPTGPLPDAAAVRRRLARRRRRALERRASRPIRVMEAICLGTALVAGLASLWILRVGESTGGAVSAPETLSLFGPSLAGGSALFGALALAAIVGVVVFTALSEA